MYKFVIENVIFHTDQLTFIQHKMFFTGNFQLVYTYILLSDNSTDVK